MVNGSLSVDESAVLHIESYNKAALLTLSVCTFHYLRVVSCAYQIL